MRITTHLFFRYFLLVLFVISGFLGFSQSPEFVVKSFTHDKSSLLARINKNKRLDDNDEPCALILVRTAEEGIKFTSNSGIVGDVEWKNGDYWVFVSGGARTLKIFKRGIKTIEYVFKLNPKSLETYILEIDVVRPEPKVLEWPVTIITQPENATLTIDGNTVSRESKTIKITEGEHNLTLEIPGYNKLENKIEVNENNTYFEFQLSEVENVALMIETEPEGATVYLDGIKLGETPISAFYPNGTYELKIIKEGFITIKNETLTVEHPQTKKIYPLEENVGFISINTSETAKVFINDTEYPEHTNIKFAPQLLKIRITLPKAEEIEKQVVLKRNDRLSFDLYPNVATGTIQVAVTPFDANVKLTGDAGEFFTAEGMHIFRDIPVGQYNLIVKAEGFATKNENLTLIANEMLDKNIKLEKGPSGDIEMVFVKGGTFTMGCTSEQTFCDEDEKPAHEVTVSDFYIGKYEVTQKQWKDIMGSNPSNFKNCDNCPVEYVSWNDIHNFLEKLNLITGQNYCLPTEAEWEYAARGGSLAISTQYPGSNSVDEVAWYKHNSKRKTHPVGLKKPNELGIYDMAGNVYEWCSDWHEYKYYDKSPANNPKGPLSGSYRVFHGGCWSDYPGYCRVANRSRYPPKTSSCELGFRLVFTP